MPYNSVSGTENPNFTDLLILALKTIACSFDNDHEYVRCVFDYRVENFHKVFAQARQKFERELPELKKLRFVGGLASLYSYDLAETVDFLRQRGVIEIFSRRANTFEVMPRKDSQIAIQEKIQQFFVNNKNKERETAFIEFTVYLKEHLLLEATAEIKLYSNFQ